MRVVFDIETNGLESPDTVWCVGTIDLDSKAERLYGPSEIPSALEHLSQAGSLVGHNISEFDLAVLQRLYPGFRPMGRVVDTLVLSRLIYNGLSEEDGADKFGRHSLEAWGERMGFKKHKWGNFSEYTSGMGEYCMQDCRVVCRMIDLFVRNLPPTAAWNLELDYCQFLRGVERNGFTFDVSKAFALRDRVNRQLARVEGHINHRIPPKMVDTGRPAYYEIEVLSDGVLFEKYPPGVYQHPTKIACQNWMKENGLNRNDVVIRPGPNKVNRIPFNANSPKQIAEFLLKKGWVPRKVNDSGEPNTGEIELWKSGIPEGKLIAAGRGYTKLRGFCDQWIAAVRDGKLYPRFKSNQAATGRSSSSNPNIMQIPSRADKKSGMRLLRRYGDRCRELFGPQPGWTLIGTDLVGIEIRLFADLLSQFDGGSFAQLVLSGADIHQANADRIGKPRSIAKTTLYGCLYGIGPKKLSYELGCGMAEAKEIIQSFTSELPGFQELKDFLRDQLEDSGRISLIDGRRIMVSSDHKALNYAIQGNAAILMKKWAMMCSEECEELELSWRLLAVVHDEMQGESLPEHVEEIERVLIRMATAAGESLKFGVPIAAEAKHGRNWSETH